jgi:hypothetical protein
MIPRNFARNINAYSRPEENCEDDSPNRKTNGKVAKAIPTVAHNREKISALRKLERSGSVLPTRVGLDID